MSEPKDILSKFWGHESFRPLQLEIIQDAINGKDVLALLPTGGGKSICFQVPAMCQDGLCLVVSPLIALIKDQVSGLNSRGIKALSVTSEKDHREIDAILDRCIYDPEIKFLYLSPERLRTDIARERIAQMNVNLIAVDEAHCISEWGYDFRPSYLQIAEIKSLLPKVPMMALTASATPRVVVDIQEKLAFSKPNVWQGSFSRPNLSYFIDMTEDKLGRIERIATKQGGAGIIYLRSRKGTERLAKAIKNRGISADYYHAGLDTDIRTERQEHWMNGQTQIMVATNAFGMGIDKPNVRFVIHCDIPDTIENYYQECGRAGRDENKAFAVALINQKDIDVFDSKAIQSFPKKNTIKAVYDGLGSMLSLAVGSAKDETFPVDLEKLSARISIDIRTIGLSLKFLEREGYFALHERSTTLSSIQIVAEHDVVYNLREKGERGGQVLDALLRSYPRLFEELGSVSEWVIAKRLRWSKDEVSEVLQWLHDSQFITYHPASDLPRVTYTTERLQPKNVSLSDEHYKLRLHVVKEKSEAMRSFITSTHKCRSRLLLAYFGEEDLKNCGICDVCLSLEP